jgi:hypothetical protein
MSDWQQSLLDDLISYFESNVDVLGLLLFGSCSKPDFPRDDWSDIDILVVVKDDKIDDFFPAVEWITAFGRLYTYSQSSDDFKFVTRVCFENFNRIDLVITTEQKLVNVNHWPSVPFFAGTKALLARSKVVEEIASQASFPSILSLRTDEQFLKLVRNFTFKSMQAVYKVVRNDLLIALHLTQDLIRDCCILGMMLRDRATGTTIHRHGGPGNELVARLDTARKPFTSLGILESIKESNELFEKLAGEWSNTYQENRQLLLDWIEKAKVELGEQKST